MALPTVDITGRGLKVNDELCSYLNDKLQKYENLFELATSIETTITQQRATRGVDNDYSVEILVHLPNTEVRVEKEGADLHALIDQISDVLVRKLKRYKEHLKVWSGEKDWSVDEFIAPEVSTDDVDANIGMDYQPKITRRKKMESSMPISEIEAIERMEMLGYDSFLFKNLATGKYTMVYKRKKGGYGVVEPSEEM